MREGRGANGPSHGIRIPGAEWMVEMEHAIRAQRQYTQRGKRQSLLCTFAQRSRPLLLSLTQLAHRAKHLSHGFVDGVVDALVVDDQDARFTRLREDVVLDAADLAEVLNVLA